MKENCFIEHRERNFCAHARKAGEGISEDINSEVPESCVIRKKKRRVNN